MAPQWDRLVTEQPELAALFDADDPAGTGEFLRSAAGLLEGYFAVEDPRRLEPAEREALISAVVDDELLIRGYLDRLDVAPDGALRVVDYKTGGAPREAFEARALFQLKFYALVLWRTRGVVPRVLRLLYLKDAQVCDYAPDAEELLRFERTVVALWQAIEAATARQDFRPRPSRLCDWCNHQALCPTFGGTPPPFPVAAAPADPLVDARPGPPAPARTSDPPLTRAAHAQRHAPGRPGGQAGGGSPSRAASSSRSTPVRLSNWCTPSVGAIGSSAGTASTAAPEARALATPVGESSIATQRSIGTPSSRAAVRYGSGCGLVAPTSSPQTITSKLSRPRVSSATSTTERRLEVTRAVGMPAARTARSSATAPGRIGTSVRNSSRIRASIHFALATGSRCGWPRSSCRIRIESAMLVPMMARRAASERVPPYSTASSRRAMVHSPSLSIRVPSMSKSTAAGCWLLSGSSRGVTGSARLSSARRARDARTRPG